MTKEELKQAFIHGNVAGAVLHCDKKSVTEGLESLTELISKATSADSTSTTAISSLQNLNGFYGVVKNNCLSEDNLLYDLDIPSYGGDNTEHIVDDFKKDTQELIDLVTKLKADIEATVSAIDIYNNRDSYTPAQLAAAAEGISLFDDYNRLGDYANKYTDQQFSGSSGGGRASVGSYKKTPATPVPSTESNIKKETPDWNPKKTEVEKIPTNDEKKKVIDVEKIKDDTKKEDNTPLKSDNDKKEDTQKDITRENSQQITVNPVEKIPMNTKPTDERKIEQQPVKSVTTIGSSDTVHAGAVKGFNQNTKEEDKVKAELAKKTAISTNGSLASSINTTSMRQKGIDKITKIEKPIDAKTEQKKSYILPTAAALSASAAAGIGTKAYVGSYGTTNVNAKKEKDKKDEEKREEKEDILNEEYSLPETEVLEELDERESSHDAFKLSD